MATKKNALKAAKEKTAVSAKKKPDTLKKESKTSEKKPMVKATKQVAQTSAKAVAKNAKPVAKAVKSVAKPAKTVAKASKQETKTPVKMTAKNAKPEAKAVKSVAKPAKPVAKASKPVVKAPAKVAAKSIKPEVKAVKSVAKVAKPIAKAAKPAVKASKPIEKTTNPASQPKAKSEPAKPAATASAGKKLCRIISYDKMTPEIKALFEARYPDGYTDAVMRYPKPSGESFYAVGLYTQDADYLIKVDVDVDMSALDEDYGSEEANMEEVEGENSNDGQGSPDVNDLADSLADETSDPV